MSAPPCVRGNDGMKSHSLTGDSSLEPGQNRPLAFVQFRPRVCRTFLKEFVKRVRFPSGDLRKGSAWRDRLFWLIVDPLRLVAGLDSFWSSSLREVAIVLFNARLLPNHSFARRRSCYARAALPGGGRR